MIGIDVERGGKMKKWKTIGLDWSNTDDKREG